LDSVPIRPESDQPVSALTVSENLIMGAVLHFQVLAILLSEFRNLCLQSCQPFANARSSDGILDQQVEETTGVFKVEGSRCSMTGDLEGRSGSSST
jgi:hypothetical protein